jgi:hypothetical protein
MMVALLNGLGSRVLMLAKCMSANIVPDIDWANGPECPCYYQTVFPNGIPRLSMKNSEAGNRYGFLLNLKIDESRYRENVRLIFSAMELPEPEPLELGVIYRSHFGDTIPDVLFYQNLDDALKNTTGKVATLCDKNRQQVTSFIGDRAILQTSDEMQFDLDRSESNVRPYLEEWWRVLNCKQIVTNNPASTTIWPHKFLRE